MKMITDERLNLDKKHLRRNFILIVSSYQRIDFVQKFDNVFWSILPELR